MLTSAVTGLATGFVLILAIGAQNIFVLRQGLMNLHIFWVCAVCAASDSILIGLGVRGAASLIATFPWAMKAMTWAGATFLAVYGAFNMLRAFKTRALSVECRGTGSLKTAIATCLALTWLNPHVYLDTVGIIGAVSAGFIEPKEKFAYWFGASSASFMFFYGLGYGARAFAPIFAQPRAWTTLDVGTSLVMWMIAVLLVINL